MLYKLTRPQRNNIVMQCNSTCLDFTLFLCSFLVSINDVFPTLAALVGGEVPDDRVIDGTYIMGIMVLMMCRTDMIMGRIAFMIRSMA